MDEYLITKQLTVGYDGKPLIRDIELRLQRGRILALIGPNGGGKSTILKTITKYIKSLNGVVLIDNASIDGMSGAELAKKVSVVLTRRIKTQHMTCGEVVETGRYPYTGRLGILSAHDRQKVTEAMALVHAAELRERDFMRISDGQRQRVMLARAICREPELIALDEPATFLDVRYKLELLDILRTLARERGVAVIISLHELDMAQRIADDVMCVKGETILHYGSAEEIFKKELIEELYGLDNGSFNPLFGSLELAKPAGEPRLFVIAGGGAGTAAYRALQKNRVPFITGILHENDVDYQTAKAIASDVIAERGFERIGDAAYARALDALKGCDTVLNCLTGYGEMNVRNKELYQTAQAMGLKQLEQ